MPRPRLCDCGSCRRCGHRAYMAAYRAAHPGKDRWTERGQRLIESAKDVPCADCGRRFPHYVMDFDHVRGTKLFAIGSMARASAVEKLLTEIAKCDVVCANCHRERTFTRSPAHS